MTELNAIRRQFKLDMRYIGLINGQRQLFEPDFEEFKQWVYQQHVVQFDFETNVTDKVRERKIITAQFGSVGKKQNQQWGFQWSYLTQEQKQFIFFVLESTMWEKIIQYAPFEIMVCLNYGVRLRNVYDTALQEQVLWCGYSGANQVSASLEDIALRRLHFVMSKDEQTNFGDDFITPAKIEYMGRDVLVLDLIKRQQIIELAENNLEYVAALENESVIGFAQMMWEGMELDRDEWLSNLEWAKPQLEEAEHKLDKWLHEEPFRSKAIKLGYINLEDKVQLNWNSNVHKAMVAQKLFPGCSGGSKPIVSKWFFEAVKAGEHTEIHDIAYEFINTKNKEKVLAYLLEHHREWLIENELLRPAGTSVINWNSVDQVLPLLQTVSPFMKNMNADSMGKFSHPIGLDIEHFKEVLKLTTTYGEEFLKHIDPDGKVRTTFQQILTTGRISSAKPNMQNVTVKEFVGLRYRNCFKPPPGYKFVSSDYVSQELAVIAHVTGDKTWQEAIRKKQDLHSIASELVFASSKNPFHVSWKDAAEAGCAYYKMEVGTTGKLEAAHQKCKCKRHKVMRDACKNINFGLAYGMTEYRLAAMLRISVKEARALIDDYFKAMPAIGKTMTFLGRYGVRNGFIKTLAPFFRKRWFPEWKERQKYIDEHISDIRPDRVLSSIEKQSKNQPIQGTSADITKIAICMVMWELDEKNLHDTVKLVLQVHDQLDTVCRDDHAEQWKPRLTELMEEAAMVVIPTGLLKAETTITHVWSK